MSTCTCGHRKRDHIYEEGACRPGIVCESKCEQFTDSLEEIIYLREYKTKYEDLLRIYKRLAEEERNSSRSIMALLDKLHESKAAHAKAIEELRAARETMLSATENLDRILKSEGINLTAQRAHSSFHELGRALTSIDAFLAALEGKE